MEKVRRQAPSVRDILRAHTRDDHERLHRHSSFVALFGETQTRGQYRDLMQRMYGFYLPLDVAIGRALSETARCGATYPHVSRSGLLAQDMADLGFSERAIADTPQCTAAIGSVSPGNLGGVLYVIEGATLGGATIDRAAHRLLGGDRPVGRGFWAWCRSVNKQRWSMMTRYLDQVAADGAAIDDLKTGARDTFRMLADWLAPLDRPAASVELRRP